MKTDPRRAQMSTLIKSRLRETDRVMKKDCERERERDKKKTN